MKVGFKSWRMHRQQNFVLVLSSLLLLLFFSTTVFVRPCFAASHEEVEILSAVAAAGSFDNGEEVHEVRRWWSNGMATASHECVEHYGVMPCSTSLGGNVALLVIYGYMLLIAAQLLSEGSELLLTVLSPGIIGGLVLPILGALPDALLILVSGLGANQAEAQTEVLVGMGLLAGSSVMVLTALWGSCLIFGRCDLVNGVAKDRQLTPANRFSLFGTGVTTDPETKWLSWIMMATLLPYLVAQLPQLLGLTTGGSLAVATAGVISVVWLIVYFVYQLVAPWIQERRISWAKHKYRLHILHKLHYFMHSNNWGPLFGEGDTNLERVFDYFDTDKDEMLTREELKGLIVGLGIQNQRKVPSEHEVALWMKEFDLDDKDDRITKNEFYKGMRTWMNSVKRTNGSGTSLDFNSSDVAPPNPFDAEAQTDRYLLSTLQEDEDDEDDEDGDKESKPPPTRTQIITRAVLYLIAGAAIAAIFSDPLVDAIGGFSKASGIPPFFIAFIATPLATNSSEAISSILFARGKRKRNISMTYSQIYGAVTMNNTLCLSIFLAIVHFRGLLWDFSAEVTVILFSTLVMGGVAAARTTFPLWMAFIGIALYPISIGLVAFLDYVCGWH